MTFVAKELAKAAFVHHNCREGNALKHNATLKVLEMRIKEPHVTLTSDL